MNCLHQCMIDARISGDAKKILHLLKASSLKNSISSVEISTIVCFPPYRWAEPFWLPEIKKGNISGASHSIASLFRQKALNYDQFEQLAGYVQEAQVLTQ